MTAHTAEGSPTGPPNDALLGLPDAVAIEAWQQPPLLSPPPRSVQHRALRSSERQRQVGLAAIAQAREALAEASRRAREASHRHAA